MSINCSLFCTTSSVYEIVKECLNLVPLGIDLVCLHVNVGLDEACD